MATTRPRNDFINFILDSDADEKLVNEFMKQKTVKQLQSFFQKRGYKDIPANDCEDIQKAMGIMRGRHIPSEGQTAKGACVPGAKVY